MSEKVSSGGPKGLSAGATATNGAPTSENEGFLGKYGTTILRALAIWVITRMLFGSLTPAKTPAPTDKPAAPSQASASVSEPVHLPSGIVYSPYNWITPQTPQNLAPFWPTGVPMDLYVWLTEHAYFNNYTLKPTWKTENIRWGDYNDQRSHKVVIPTSSHVQHNGSIWAHVFLTQHNAAIDPDDNSYVSNHVVYVRHQITKYYPKKRTAKAKKLVDFSGASKVDEDEREPVETSVSTNAENGSKSLVTDFFKRGPIVSHWHENLTLSIVSDTRQALPIRAMPPNLQHLVNQERSGAVDVSRQLGYYLPVLYPNDFWNLREHSYEVNETISELPLNIMLQPLSFMKFQIYGGLAHSMETQQNSPMGGATAQEMDEMKRMLLETNPILLGTTIVVSILHSLFEFLAFKNDISFWNKKQDQTGVSVRTLFVNIFSQIIIFLYLMDNNSETSWMILLGQGAGLAVELWKVKKVLRYEFVRVPHFIPWRIRLIEDAPKLTETEEKTAEYDALAFKYLSWVAYPALICYAIYSLIYETHKSWYSYVIGTLVGFIYTFGFITMTPQLFINYKLKSVAHMPWRTLMYKSLNTFIDDLFAFVIKMPTLHRLACLRDDAVFFVYLYQRWAYKTDHTRVNEFGQVGDTNTEEETEAKKEK